MVTMVRGPVVPADHVGSREGSVQRFARNAHRAIALATDRVDDLVVTGAQVIDREVSAEFHVAKETHTWISGHLLIGGGDGLDLLMIRCHAAAAQSGRRRQPIEHIHADSQVRRFEQRLCCIESGWSRSNDGDAERAFDSARGAHALPLGVLTHKKSSRRQPTWTGRTLLAGFGWSRQFLLWR